MGQGSTHAARATQEDQAVCGVNVPAPLIAELRSAGLVLHPARQEGSAGRPDQNIYQEARQRGLVLLTMDRDFWYDSEHPLQTTGGIIFVDVAPDQLEKATDGLARFYALFAKYYPLDWWKGTKVRVYEHGFRCSEPHVARSDFRRRISVDRVRQVANESLKVTLKTV